jgi:amphi-Trp domain-containing protein
MRSGFTVGGRGAAGLIPPFAGGGHPRQSAGSATLLNTTATVCVTMANEDHDEEHDDPEHEAEEAEEHEEEYEAEDVSRTEAAAVLNAVADGVLAGAVRLGEDDDGIAVDVPESVSVEVELEAGDDEVELEVELEWPAPGEEAPVSPLDEHPDAAEPGGVESGEDAAEVEGADAEEGGESMGEEQVEEEATAGHPMPVGAVEPVESLAGFEVFADRGGEWRWRLRHRNGNIIATSGEGYTRKHNAWKGLRSVMRNASGAAVTENDGGGEN